MLVVDSIEELNALLAARPMTPTMHAASGIAPTLLGHDWAIEKSLLRPLPDELFDTALTLTPRMFHHQWGAKR
jgi:hypothetical protein